MVRPSPTLPWSLIGLIALVFVAGAAATGHPAVAEVGAGLLIMVLAVILAVHVTPRAGDESDINKLMFLDVEIVLLVLLFLAGAGIAGMAVP